MIGGKAEMRRILLIAFMLALIVASWFVWREFTSDTADISSGQNTRTTTNGTASISAEGRYLFSGTIVPARAVENLAVNASGERDYSQPFSKLYTFNPEQYDAWAADFECPITDNVVPYRVQIETLVFNCRPEFLPEMTKYITLYNLANNHTSDQGGVEGLLSTRQYLDDAGVQYFGHFDPSVTEDICEVIALPISIESSEEQSREATLPVAFCSWHYFNYNRSPTDEELAVARKYAEVMPVFGFVEMGTEYQAEASSDQVEIARSIIDAGAEFVLANNPHWVQNSEAYKGKLIVYSLGNFIFDQIEPETLRGVSIDTTLRIASSNNLQSWLDVAERCNPEVYKDECLEQAKQQSLSKLPITLTYDAVANTSGYRKVTEKADEATQAAVKERLRWEETITALEAATE